MNVVFRVDASLKIGIGHVMRCLTLAQILSGKGAKIDFICRELEGNLIHEIQIRGFNVLTLKPYKEINIDKKLPNSHLLEVTQKQDAEDCKNILRKTKTDWLIVDHYGIDEDWHKELSYFYNNIMVIDDLADRKHQCNILLDQTFGRSSLDYNNLVPESCHLLIGSQYALLRSEFTKWRHYSLTRRKNPEFVKLLISMGGIDSGNFTEQVLNNIGECNLPHNLEVTILMGKLAPFLERVKNKASKLSCTTIVKVDIDNIAETMANSDFAIGAPGSTTWERCCLGVPSLLIIQAENQKFIAQNMESNKSALIVKKISNIVTVLNDSFFKRDVKLITRLVDSSSNIIDGKGAFRVINNLN
jgi:UDP-2,4-diacetamido-2,4,6-trideoxy-beta-L-altropyranose hydrolase